MDRAYRPEDLGALQRIWRECGWVESADEAAHLESFLADGVVRVAELDGEVECAVSTHPGALSYLGRDLSLLAVTSVTTSWVGRKRGLATRLSAEAVGAGAAAGAQVAALGAFELGFYNQLGFGTGAYEHLVRFDPGSLTVDAPYRTPVRITVDDYAEIAELQRRRHRGHGGIAIWSPGWVRADLNWTAPPLGLGYRNDEGRLTHLIWGKTKGESGPYRIHFTFYETPAQLLELLALMRALGDQVRAMSMPEPAEVQLEDLLRHPVRARIATKGSEFEATNRAEAWWQVRILDLEACMAAHRWGGPPVRFNLELSDPLSEMPHVGWEGLGGSYIIEVGAPSSARRGGDDSLPTMRTSVNALSRMWIGARPASSLRLTDDLEASNELVTALDEAWRLPTPHTGLFF